MKRTSLTLISIDFKPKKSITKQHKVQVLLFFVYLHKNLNQ